MPDKDKPKRSTSQPVQTEVLNDRVAGRLRLRDARLILSPMRTRAVQAALRAEAGIIAVSVNLHAGTVLVRFKAPASRHRIFAAIDHAIAFPDEVSRKAAPAAPSGSAISLRDDEIKWHALPVVEVEGILGGNAKEGLSENEVRRRLARHGRNELKRSDPRHIQAIFAEQMTNLPVALLGFSAVLSVATGGIADAIIIGAVVLANASIAAATERRAERTILGMAQVDPGMVQVMREGSLLATEPAMLVPGDVFRLERGMMVPADARLVWSEGLAVNEAPLTGEAMPVEKQARAILPMETLLTSRSNMVFRGTAVTGGSGLAMVTETGQETQIGRVQRLMGSVRPPQTPIQRQLGDVERELVFVNLAICAAMVAMGALRGQSLVANIRTAISLAVAAIPEGLPAVATTTLAIGVRDMQKRNVLVRKLDAVETLGAVQTVGLDKTGTLTEDRMAMAAIHTAGETVRFDGATPAMEPAIRLIVASLLETVSLCSDTLIAVTATGTRFEGTPTEAALVEAASAFGIDVGLLRNRHPLLTTVLRSEGRKRMSTLHACDGGIRLLCVKGDPLEILDRCTAVRTATGIAPLDDELRAGIRKANVAMAGQALRVLGVAMSTDNPDPRDERGLVWLGLAGLRNPLRPSVAPALKQLHRAGIRTIMITGDQSATAYAIARELKLDGAGEIRVLEAGDLAGKEFPLLGALVERAQVFSRVSPVDKLNIVKALQANGRVVAMTGDGVNDGPALRAADVGVSMGGAGNAVAREVADIVLLTDDLAGIIDAIRLGRATYSNIRKVLRYLVSTNASETILMFSAGLAGINAPLNPMQLLWLNLASDPLPALALGLEPPEPGVMDAGPHDPRAPILAAADFRRILAEGAAMGVTSLAGYYLMGGASSGNRAGTVTFHGLTASQLLHAFASRTERGGFTSGILRRPTPALFGAIGVSAALQAGVQLVPTARRLLGLAPLSMRDLGAIGAIAAGSAIASDVIAAAVSRMDRPTNRKATGPESKEP